MDFGFSVDIDCFIASIRDSDPFAVLTYSQEEAIAHVNQFNWSNF